MSAAVEEQRENVDAKTMSVRIDSIEVSLNDHQLHYLVGIMATVLLPTSPVAVEHLTSELELKHKEEMSDVPEHNIRYMLYLRRRLIGEIQENSWILNSKYAQSVVQNDVLSLVEDPFYTYLRAKERELVQLKDQLRDLEQKWSIILAIHKVKEAESQPIDQRLTNFFLSLRIESFQLECSISRIGEEPFIAISISRIGVQIKEMEDQSGVIAAELRSVAVYNLLAIKKPEYHSWKDMVTMWDMVGGSGDANADSIHFNETDHVMLSIQITHRFVGGIREIHSAELNAAPLRIKVTMQVIDALIEFATGSHLKKQNKARTKETKKAMASHLSDGLNLSHSISSSSDKFKRNLSKKAKQMMFKKGKADGGGGDADKYEEEYQLITQFRHHAEMLIAKQSQFVKIWRLRIGAFYVLLNFIGPVTVFDMKLKINPKVYNSRNHREALDVIRILKKDYIRMLITKLPNTFLKQSVLGFFGMKNREPDNEDNGNGMRTFKKYKARVSRKLHTANRNMLVIEQTLDEEDEEEDDEENMIHYD